MSFVGEWIDSVFPWVMSGAGFVLWLWAFVPLAIDCCREKSTVTRKR